MPDGVWIRTRRENFVTTAFIIQACNHCDEPACVAACPWHVPGFAKTEGKVYKCDACAKRLAQGLAPACAASCPMGAIEFGPIDELRQKYPEAVETGNAWAKKQFGYEDLKTTGGNLVIVPLK